MKTTTGEKDNETIFKDIDNDAVYLLFHTYFPEDYPLYATTPAMTVMETIETKKDEE